MFNNFLGKDGFIWWIGVVEDRHDPLYIGRCKVRIFGWHTAAKRDMPTEALPWTYPLMPITSASMTGVGISPTGPVEGTWVLGFFRDGENAQHPVMIGTFHGVPNYDVSTKYTKDLGFYDPRMYDGSIDPSIHELDINTMTQRVGIRSLKFLSGDSQSNVPREPLFIEPVLDETTEKPTGNGIRIVEIPMRSPYPDVRYTGEPTTPRSARGKNDPTSNLELDPSGALIGQGPRAIKQQIRNNYLTNFSVPHEYFSSNKTTVSFTPPSEFEAATVDDLVPPKSLKFWEEYEGVFNPKYPYNHVHQTESGHLIEYDDTPGAERLHWYHRSGTFTEIYARGDRVDRIHGGHYYSTFKDLKSKIFGHKFDNVNKSYGIRINESGNPSHNYSIWVGPNSSMYTRIERGNYFLDNTVEDKDIDGNKIFGKVQIDTENFVVNAKDSISLNSKSIITSDTVEEFGVYKQKTENAAGATYSRIKNAIISSEVFSVNVSQESKIVTQSSNIILQDYLETTNYQHWEIIRNSNLSLGAPGTETATEGPIGKRITVGIGDIVLDALGGATSAVGGVYLLAGAGPSGAVAETALSTTSFSLTGALKPIQGAKKTLTGSTLETFSKASFIMDATGTIETNSLLTTTINATTGITLDTPALLSFKGNPLLSAATGSTFGTAPEGNLKKWLDALLDVLSALTVGTGVGPSSTPINGADITLLKTQLATFME